MFTLEILKLKSHFYICIQWTNVGVVRTPVLDCCGMLLLDLWE